MIWKKTEDALKQIEDKGYDMELRSEGYKKYYKVWHKFL